MFNTKWGVRAALAAFVLSLAIGLLSGGHFGHALLRAAIFALVFFGLGVGAWFLVNNFIPELLFSDTASSPLEDAAGPIPGSRVNITLGDTSGAALPETGEPSIDSDDIGNITDLTAKAGPTATVRMAENLGGQAIDQRGKDGYTMGGGLPGADAAPGIVNGGDVGGKDASGKDADGFSLNFGGLVTGDTDGELGALPDLGGLHGSFVGGSERASGQPEDPSMPVRNPMGNKAEKIEGDFNPKEIAAGIRNVLNKEK